MNKGDFANSHNSFMDITFTNKKKIKSDPELIKAAKEKRDRFYNIEDERLKKELEDWDYDS